MTSDHGLVREWAKAWGLQPRRLGDRLSLHDGQEITWDAWLSQFDAEGLALVTEGANPDGARSVIYRLEPRSEPPAG